jgi:hypothetical protein
MGLCLFAPPAMIGLVAEVDRLASGGAECRTNGVGEVVGTQRVARGLESEIENQ